MQVGIRTLKQEIVTLGTKLDTCYRKSARLSMYAKNVSHILDKLQVISIIYFILLIRRNNLIVL